MIYLYNTLSRQKEEFVPIKAGDVGIYTCGLTVNNYAHIGHGVAYILMDSLVKVLRLNGLKVKNVMNITDVGHLTSDEDEGDDKIAAAAKREGKDAYGIAQFYTDYFLKFLDRLNVVKPTIVCRATSHIEDMKKFVEELEKNGYTYTTADGVYFDVSKFEGYGKLSRKNLDEQKAGARVEVAGGKKNAHDFALWKLVTPNTLMKWPSKWGEHGCPGWHIECSAMSHKYLGPQFDIHTGGTDHIPIHHENEIAQSEGRFGKKTVNYWLHCDFLKVDGIKMSKSLGNLYRLEDLEARGYDPLDFRYFCLNASYRKPINFTFEALAGMKTTRVRLYEAALEHKRGNTLMGITAVESLRQDFLNNINDDLNIAKALGDIWTAVKNLPKSADIYSYLLWCDQVLSLDIKENVERLEKEQAARAGEAVPQNIIDLANKRIDAKKAKDFAKADELRGQIEKAGYKITDTAGGFNISKI